jgi:hypothetical protein
VPAHQVLSDPRISLLFLVPGVGETLRVNGTACLSVPSQLSAVPSAGSMLAALSANQVGGDDYDRALPARQRSTLY